MLRTQAARLICNSRVITAKRTFALATRAAAYSRPAAVSLSQ